MNITFKIDGKGRTLFSEFAMSWLFFVLHFYTLFCLMCSNAFWYTTRNWNSRLKNYNQYFFNNLLSLSIEKMTLRTIADSLVPSLFDHKNNQRISYCSTLKHLRLSDSQGGMSECLIQTWSSLKRHLMNACMWSAGTRFMISLLFKKYRCTKICWD